MRPRGVPYGGTAGRQAAVSRARNARGPERSTQLILAAANCTRAERTRPDLVGLVRRSGALVRDAGDDEFVRLEAAFAGHGG